MEFGTVDQVLELSLCAIAFSGYVLFAFVPIERLPKCKHEGTRKKVVIMSVVINCEQNLLFTRGFNVR